MNKTQAIHLERKEHWRALIRECDGSGMTQQEWCKENKVCCASISRWRTQIWREEEAEKEFAALRALKMETEIGADGETEVEEETEAEVEVKAGLDNKEEENRFVEMTAVMIQKEEETKAAEKTDETIGQPRKIRLSRNHPASVTQHLQKPDAVIGYQEYLVGVYEHTSSQVLQKVMEVLRHVS